MVAPMNNAETTAAIGQFNYKSGAAGAVSALLQLERLSADSVGLSGRPGERARRMPNWSGSDLKFLLITPACSVLTVSSAAFRTAVAKAEVRNI